MAESYNYSPVGAEYWLVAEPLLIEALHTGADLFSPEEMYQKIKDGDASLWLSNSKQSAAVTTWTQSSAGPILNLWLAGGKLDELRDMLISAEQWGKQRGAVRAMIAGRKGWEKVLPGYEYHATLFLKEL